MIRASRARLQLALDVAILASITLLPHLLGGRGRLNADTKQYLYLDPGDLLERARNLWDPAVGGGTVTHQAIGYLWPMGPYYWLTDQIGLASWVAQRLWIGGIQLVAALGALALFRALGPRHPAQLAGAALYGLSPFVLGHVTGQSGLLLPFAAFGWLVWAMVRAVERGGWRWPAVFALVVTSCASLNGSSVFFVVLGATIWVPVAVWSLRDATPREGVGALLRAGVLTLATQLWWLVAYAVGGANGLPILSVTEQVQTTSYTASGAEVLRGLGYWFFYGADSEGLWLRGLAPPYMERPALLALSFAVPVVALALGAIVRWGPRTYFAVLVGTGTAIAVGAFPEPARSPVGAAFEALSRRSELVLSLRNTQRAGPLVALGLAGLVVAGLTAIDRRHPRAALAGLGVVGLLVALALPAQWRSALIAERFHREEVPQAWVDAGAHLDEGSGRVLEVPGIDFASYRWGHTLDPVSVGLTDRPVIARELVPAGGAPGASLLGALDRAVQEGWAEPGMVATVARLLGASQVLVRSDLEYERYRTVRPARFWDLVTAPGSPLELGETFDSGEPNRANPRRPMLDEIELALDADADPPPQIAVFDVPDGGRPAVSAIPVRGGVVVDGDGEGIVQAGAAGLLDGLIGPLLLGADLARDTSGFDRLTPDGTAFVITDTNRKRGERWYALRENVGATEPAAHPAVLDDPTDARLEVVAGQPASARTTVEWSGAQRVWATAYGSALTLVPEERPSNAFDGDASTAWLLDTRQHRGPHRVGVELDEPLDGADHVVLVPPQRRPGARAVIRARVTLDGSRHFDVELDEAAARDPEGVRVALDGEPFRRLTVEIRDVLPDDGPAGFAEIRVPGLEVRELVVLPTAVLDALGARAAEAPLSLVLSRHRSDPAEPVRSDPEPALARAFDLPAPLEVELRGTARLSARADDAVLASLLGDPDPPRTSESLPGDLRSTASAAIDGDASTAWRTPLVGLVGQWIDLPADPGTEITTLELTVLADGRHSLPTELAVSAGGRTVSAGVPPVESVAEAGTVRQVEVTLPEGLRGDRLRIEITGVDARTTTDWYTGDPIALPVGLAEIAGSGLRTGVDQQAVDTGCRDDLVQLDGAPLPVRITGSADAALDREGLDVEACDGALRLGPGRHELRAAKGATTGIDLDRLVLATPGFAVDGSPGDAAEVRVGSVGAVSAEATIESDGSPFWLVLDQSHNEGWELSLDGATVDGPRPVDGYAAGWHVTPDGAGTLVADIRWAPQRVVDIALLLSLLAAAACAALVVIAPGQRRGPRPVLAAPDVGPAGPVRRWIAVAGGAVVAGLLVHPLAALPAAATLLLARRWPWVGRAVPVLLVGAAAAQVVLFQVRDRHEAAFEWPQHFGGAHLSALLGAVLLAVLATAEGRGAQR
jgi:hypothetical protein